MKILNCKQIIKNMEETNIPSINEIELAIMQYEDFDFQRNLMVFRAKEWSNVVNHECDCLMMSKSGYLTEIEIKRSYADFLADFHKTHEHNDPAISQFYFLIHDSFKEKAFEKLVELKKVPDKIYTYNDKCEIKEWKCSGDVIDAIKQKYGIRPEYKLYSHWHERKLFLEEQYQLARLGAMRYRFSLEKIVKLTNKK